MKKIVSVNYMVEVETPEGITLDNDTLLLAATTATLKGEAKAENIHARVTARERTILN